MSVWLLTAGNYSDYHVVGAFADETAARKMEAELDGADSGYEDYQVEEVPILGEELRAEPLFTGLHLQLSVKWNGIVGADDGDPTSNHYEQRVRAVRRVRVRGLPEGVPEEPIPDDDEEDDDLSPYWSMRSGRSPDSCRTTWEPFETGYTLGVELNVWGTDIERVRKVFSEKRAQALADPAGHVIRAWIAQDRKQIAAWIWQRPENQPILDALRRGGLT